MRLRRIWNRSTWRAGVLALLIGSVAALCAGCGAGGSGTSGTGPLATGSASFTVVWPASPASRLIPAASQSVRLDVKSGATLLASQVLNRPAAGGPLTATFQNLPVGQVTNVATAFPQAGAQGVPQAQGTDVVTILPGGDTQATITMVSTIDHIDLTPANPSLQIGQTTTLTATARDASGDEVLIANNNLQWASLDPLVATVDAGVVTAKSHGTARISVTESESQKSTQTTVTVGLPVVTITPPGATLAPGGSQTFTAAVSGTVNQGVNWTVQEGVSGGTISTSGVYTAPANAGTYHVVATSQADSSAQATVPVSVHLTVGITPPAPVLSVGDTQQFTATVAGSPNTGVIWTVTEANGGTITPQGLYTAPATHGTYHVVATSQADSTQSATAVVTVQSGSSTVTIS